MVSYFDKDNKPLTETLPLHHLIAPKSLMKNLIANIPYSMKPNL